MLDESLYKGREQTYIKHNILEKYLERFAHIIGYSWDSLTYVDCFSGPWNQESKSFEDTSFGIALTQLRKARADLNNSSKKSFKIRCFFLEKDTQAFAQLKEFTDDIQDVEICIKNGEFENSIDDILEFVRQDSSTFPFVFIDPTGWNGIALETIRPLLELEPGEVLVNFMTSYIRRFVNSPRESDKESFRRLYATEEYLSHVRDVQDPMDREDEIVNFYCVQLAELGHFRFVSKAIILDPDRDATQYHLVYATRHQKGLTEFKRVEEKAMKIMEDKRLSRKETGSELTPFLFEMGDYGTPPPTHYEFLRERYSQMAYSQVVNMLNERRAVDYDEIWALALLYPLTWDKDLKEWLKRWTDKISIEGMSERQRVPRIDQGAVLRMRNDETLS